MLKNKKTLIFTILILCLFVSFVYSQTNLTKLYDPAFKTHQRPPVYFPHDKHNQKASLYDCSICHHLYKDGKLLKGAMSIGMKCYDCHKLKKTPKNRYPLMEAYHRMCIDCHKAKKKGPITCGECHKKQITR